jgi:hypothetical protein
MANLNTIHSKEYCIKRIAEIKAKNKNKEMSLGDVLMLDNFKRILKAYNGNK